MHEMQLELIGFLCSPDPDPNADLRKKPILVIGPLKKPDPKYQTSVKQR